MTGSGGTGPGFVVGGIALAGGVRFDARAAGSVKLWGALFFDSSLFALLLLSLVALY